MIYKSTIEKIIGIGNNRTTLLTDGYSLNEGSEAWKKKREEKDRAYENARIIAWTVWYEGYERGDIGFRELIERARDSLLALGVEDFLRWKTLGLLADKALAMTPPKRKRGNAGRVDPKKAIAVQLVDLASGDGFVLSRESKNGASAFDHVAELMTRLGMDTTSRQVHDWCYPRSKGKIPR